LAYQGSFLIADSEFDTNVSQLAYRFNNHVPNQFTYRLPQFQTADRTKWRRCSSRTPGRATG